MSDTEVSVLAWVQRALDEAFRRAEANATTTLNRARSRAFVAALAADLRVREPALHVLDREHKGHVRELGLCELLFDVAAFKAGRLRSPRGEELTYIKEPVWIVESELHPHNTRAILTDFNKLALAGECCKLFVGADSPTLRDFAHKQLREAARHCAGRVFVALVLTPGSWEQDLQVEFCFEL